MIRVHLANGNSVDYSEPGLKIGILDRVLTLYKQPEQGEPWKDDKDDFLEIRHAWREGWTHVHMIEDE